MNMKKNQSVILLLVLVCCMVMMVVVAGGAAEEKQEPNAAERAMGYIDPVNHWEKLKSMVKIGWLKYAPSSLPSLQRSENPHPDAGDRMKEAVTKSFETTKETAEHTAKYAGDAMHKTAEKVKSAVSYSGSEGEDKEL